MLNVCRGKRVDTNEWIVGYYVFDKEDTIVQDLNMRVRGLAELTNAYVVHSDTVTLCSGKCDKNENLIFEGDIISWFGNINYIVRNGEFEGKVGLGYYYGVGFYLERIGDPTHRVPLSPVSCDANEYEIVGNIYDNKELLKIEE
jgi:uncharacterized phage protein (TIGR01671 family)